MKFANGKGKDFRCRLPLLGGMMAAGLGLTALIGWVADQPVLTTLQMDKIPMAPSTALLFVIYGATFSMPAGQPQSRTRQGLSRAVIFFATLIALLLFVLSSAGIHLPAEYLGMRISGTVAGAPIGHMSPLTGFCFVLVGTGFLLRPVTSGHRKRRLAPAFGLASLVLLISVVLAVAYLLGGPLFYGSGVIPPALTTTLAFLGLAVALLAACGYDVELLCGRENTTNVQATSALILIFIVTATGVIASGYVYFDKHQKHFRAEAEQALAAIAELKVADLAQWRRELLADAAVFVENESFSLTLQHFFEEPDEIRWRKELLLILSRMQAAHRYGRVAILDRQGVEMLAVPDAAGAFAGLPAFDPAGMLRAGHGPRLDFAAYDPGQAIHLSLLMPISDATAARQVLGILVFAIDPAQYLYPMIKRWPTPSRSAETLLVRRDGDDVLFLNDLRFRENSALRLRLPLTRTDLPAAMAILGNKEGSVEGIDYRGVPVVAAVRRVPDSSWYLVARMDKAEVYETLLEQLWMVAWLVVALLVGSGAVIGLLWYNQMGHFYRARYAAAEALRESEERYRTTIEHLNRVLMAVRSINQLIIHENNSDRLLRQACDLLVQHRSYSGALIIVIAGKNPAPTTYVEAGMGEVLRPLAGLLEGGELPPCCDVARQQQGVLLIRKSAESLCAGCAIGETQAEKDAMCVALTHDHDLFGYLIVLMTPGTDVAAGEQELFAEMADDIAFALHSIRNQQAKEQAEQAQKTLEVQLQQAQKMEAVGRLAGGVAHDFNNMLQAILGYADIALGEIGTAQPLREYLEEIQKSGRRSADLTRQLLAFARKQTIAPRILDLNATIAGMLKMLQRLIGEDIDLLWEPAADCGPVLMDSSQLDQILANLVVNARDAITGVGKITIETGMAEFDEAYCRVHAGFKPGRYVLLAVSDNGIGMEPSTLAAIFEPFFTTKPQGQGTGLGLATVYGIVKQNGGFINVYSEPGQGSTFKIYLVLHETATAVAVGEKQEADKSPTGTETILLVEDEQDLLKLGQRMVQRLGYSVLTAGSPQAAMELAAHYRGTIDLLLTDVIMPDMSGRVLYRKLREQRPELCCLFMSGYTANVISHQGILDQGVHFIQKPFSGAALAAKIREALTALTGIG